MRLAVHELVNPIRRVHLAHELTADPAPHAADAIKLRDVERYAAALLLGHRPLVARAHHRMRQGSDRRYDVLDDLRQAADVVLAVFQNLRAFVGGERWA